MNDIVKTPFLRKVTPFDKNGKADQISFKLGNDQTVVVKRKDISDENFIRAAWHGISQRLGDSCAGLSKDNSFGVAYNVLSDLKEQLGKPEWSSGRSDFGGISDLITAIANIKKKPVETVQAAIDKATDEQKKAFMKNPAIKAEIADIRARRAKQAAEADTTDIDIDLD